MLLSCSERKKDNPFDPSGTEPVILNVLSFDKRVDLSWNDPDLTDYSGFNIYRVNTETSRPYTIDYFFDEEINFKHIYNIIAAELYEVPPVEIQPILTGENEITWKNIVIRLDIPTEIKSNDLVQIKLVVDLPTTQFVRLEYVLREQIGTALSIESPRHQPILTPLSSRIFVFHLCSRCQR